MCHKAGLHIDLLHVVAYGPAVARVAAANLLFLYWPALNPNPAERKVAIISINVDVSIFSKMALQ